MDTNLKIKETYGDKKMTLDTKAVDIVSEDGRDLFSIHLLEDGSIEISAAGYVKVDDKVMDTQLSVMPRASNVVRVKRIPYEQ